MIFTFATHKKNMMIDNMSEVMIYVLNVETRETKFFYLSKSDTVKKLKINAVKTFNIPKSHVERFIFKFDFGHRLGHREFSFHKDEALPRELNKMRVSSVFTDTASIQMSLGLRGGGKNGGMSAKKVITTTRKQERMECVVKQDLSKITSADKVVEAVNGAMTHLFDKVEQGEANVVFGKLLRSLPDTVLGNEKESEVLKCLEISNCDVRLEKTIDLFLKTLYPALFSMKAEIDTTIEGASLTLEFLLSEGFIRESNGKWAWKDVKKAVLDEMKRREIIQNAGEEDSDVEMLSASVATLATG